MATCTAGRTYDTELLHSINHIIQEHNPQWPAEYPLWFDTPTTHKNAMFAKFNAAHGLIGYLPTNINRLLKNAGIRNDKTREKVIEKIDQATKTNRFNKWHNKWQLWHDKHNTEGIKRKIHEELRDVPFYNHKKAHTTPHKPATNTEKQEYNIEKIITHRYNGNNNPEYLVRWEGYGENHDTWEPETHVQNDNPCVIEYWQAQTTQQRNQPNSPPVDNTPYNTNGIIDLTAGNNTAQSWEFEDIINHRQLSNGEFEYYIKWLNYAHSDNTWEPSSNIEQPESIYKYWARVNQKRQLEQEAISNFQNITPLSYKKRRTSNNKKRTGVLRQTTITDMFTKKPKHITTNNNANNSYNNNNNNHAAHPSPPSASPQPQVLTNSTASPPPTASPQPIAQAKTKRKIMLDIDPYDFILPEPDSDTEDETYRMPKQLYNKKPKHKHKLP
jgi:hypothetical protein